MKRREFMRFLGAVPAAAIVPQFVRDFGAPTFVDAAELDFADVIYNISPVDTPFLSVLRYQTAFGAVDVVPHRWVTDELEPATRALISPEDT